MSLSESIIQRIQGFLGFQDLELRLKRKQLDSLLALERTLKLTDQEIVQKQDLWKQLVDDEATINKRRKLYHLNAGRKWYEQDTPKAIQLKQELGLDMESKTNWEAQDFSGQAAIWRFGFPQRKKDTTDIPF